MTSSFIQVKQELDNLLIKRSEITPNSPSLDDYSLKKLLQDIPNIEENYNDEFFNYLFDKVQLVWEEVWESDEDGEDVSSYDFFKLSEYLFLNLNLLKNFKSLSGETALKFYNKIPTQNFPTATYNSRWVDFANLLTSEASPFIKDANFEKLLKHKDINLDYTLGEIGKHNSLLSTLCK